MSDKFLNGAGLGALRTWVLGKLGLKQDTLVSGTNIKTINNTSLLGSGNINIQGGGGMELVSNPTANNILLTDSTGQAIDSGVNLASKVSVENTYENITSIIGNSNGTASIRVEDATSGVDAQLYVSINEVSVHTHQEVDSSLGYALDSQANLSPSQLYINLDSVDSSGYNYNSFQMTPAETTIQNVVTPTNSGDAANKQYVDNSISAALNTQATDSTLGTIKLNPSESITLNSNGQLDVGGRLGAFSGTTGIFHGKDREPRAVKDFSFLITDAKGMNLDAPRDFALVTGVNLTLKGSHAAGSTTYTVANNYANRIACAVLANGGYLSQNEAYSKENQIVPVTSVKIDGSNYTPDSSADDSSKSITITVATTANPTQAVTTLRVFGGITGGYCSEYIGQCVGGTVGASLVIGQRVYSSSNVNCIVAADVYNTGNGNSIFGRLHISKKNRWLLAGTGHDNTNGKSEAGAAVGQYSDIDANTLFAVGNGTSATVRSNAFEVLNDGIVLKSPNGTRYKITVSDTGEVTTTAL